MKTISKNILPIISLTLIGVIVVLVIYNVVTHGVASSTPFDDLG
jgi:hypothetical protein